MSGPEQEEEPRRPTGDAAWRAHRDDLDRRNAATRKTAHEHTSATDLTTAARERRLARAEEEQLRKLNARIVKGQSKSRSKRDA